MILESTATFDSQSFESLFLSLAWCLSVAEREPTRFDIRLVLWQYKWVAGDAPKYASIPRSVLERLIDDMEQKFVANGWGRRAGYHKRLELFQSLGDIDQAGSLVKQWHSVPRDRGSDCRACEADTLVDLLVDLRDMNAAWREARPIVTGRLRCTTVPHRTFGLLLWPLTVLGRHDQARELYEKGRRLVATQDQSGLRMTSRYFMFAAFIGETDDARLMLQSRLPEHAAIRADADRLRWFSDVCVGLEFLAHRGVEEIDLPKVPGIVEEGLIATQSLGATCRSIATACADALDRRNGNDFFSRRLRSLAEDWGPLPA